MLCVFVFPIEDMAKYDTYYTHVLKNRCRLEIAFEELEFVVDVAGYFYPITLQFEDLSTAVSKLPHIIIIIIIIINDDDDDDNDDDDDDDDNNNRYFDRVTASVTKLLSMWALYIN